MKTRAQEPLLTVGSPFPDLVITRIMNAPVKELCLNKDKSGKYFILNFWGTWCSPCIPEMDSLARLQKQFEGKIQVIAISDDNEERKTKYLKNKPSAIWLATDTTYLLYKMLQLEYVGQSAIIDPGKKIVALVRTDSINRPLIEKILKGVPVPASAGIKETGVTTEGDPFGVDSLTSHSFTIRGYKKGQRAMGMTYTDNENYRGRRLSWFNVPAGLLYRTAYGISSYEKQELFDSTVNSREIYSPDPDNRSQLYCVDLLVSPGQQDSLYFILQQYLDRVLPVKVRRIKKEIPVYVLKQKQGLPVMITPSAAETQRYSFSGRGYEGTKVTVAAFAAYLTNELELPVVDETGLKGFYDIKTNVEQRNKEGILKSMEPLGLTLEKTVREMPVIVYYKNK